MAGRTSLTDVVATTQSNTTAFSAQYRYTDGGRLDTAREDAPPAPGGNVQPRNVTHNYQGDDPEELTSLSSNDKRHPFAATYGYDSAGNQTSRCYGATIRGLCAGNGLQMIYDGKINCGASPIRRAARQGAVTRGSEEYWYDLDGNRNVVVKRDAKNAVSEMMVFLGPGALERSRPVRRDCEW